MGGLEVKRWKLEKEEIEPLRRQGRQEARRESKKSGVGKKGEGEKVRKCEGEKEKV